MIHVLSTSSGAGKTTVAMALCRHFSNLGMSVAPFKAMNMSLNSISTPDGYEIARSQWLQAKAARTTPARQMNPILLKPESSKRAMLIINGKTVASMSTRSYSKYIKENGSKIVYKSIVDLSKKYDLIIAEGMGAASEINLDLDLANRLPKKFKTQKVAFLVGNLEPGGMFASIYGSDKLYHEKNGIDCFIINKIRPNGNSLGKGIKKLEKLTRKKVIAAVPYLDDIALPGEDELDYMSFPKHRNYDIALIKYPHMENYSDVDHLLHSKQGINFIDAHNVKDLGSAKLIILPGSKEVVKDLEYMRKFKIDSAILDAVKAHAFVIGICGGYQMLGKQIYDPKSIESETKSIRGLGLLNIKTEFASKKLVRSVEYVFQNKSFRETSPHTGYEIRHGRTKFNGELPANVLVGGEKEGAISKSSMVVGTNIHGILGNQYFLEYVSRKSHVALKKPSLLDKEIERVTTKIMKSFDLDEMNRIIAGKS